MRLLRNGIGHVRMILGTTPELGESRASAHRVRT